MPDLVLYNTKGKKATLPCFERPIKNIKNQRFTLPRSQLVHWFSLCSHSSRQFFIKKYYRYYFLTMVCVVNLSSSICNKKLFIPHQILIFDSSRIPDPRAKKAPDPGSRSATQIFLKYFKLLIFKHQRRTSKLQEKLSALTREHLWSSTIHTLLYITICGPIFNFLDPVAVLAGKINADPLRSGSGLLLEKKIKPVVRIRISDPYL